MPSSPAKANPSKEMPRNRALLTDILSQHVFFDNGRKFCLPQMKKQSPLNTFTALLTLTNPAWKPKASSGSWALTGGARLSAGLEAWSHVCDGSSLLAHPLNFLLTLYWLKTEVKYWICLGFFIKNCVLFAIHASLFILVGCCVLNSGILLKCRKEPPDHV